MSTFIGAPRLHTTRQIATDPARRRIVRMACSLLLDYPDERLSPELAAVRAELDRLPTEIRTELAAFCDAAQAWGLRALQEQYVETFDQRRRCALSLTYYSHGDTRGRGQAILAFRELMSRAGFEMTPGEFPDYLPAVLEFSALDETGTGERLLRANREGLEVLRSALHSADSPYRHLLDALVLTLPMPDEHVLAAYRALVTEGPPSELVGIADSGPENISTENVRPEDISTENVTGRR